MPRPVPNTDEFRRQCLCPACPTFPQVLGDKSFYCSLNVSEHKLTRQGCICPECHVWYVNKLEEGLPSVYFCIDPVV